MIVVVKIGTSSLVDGSGHVDTAEIGRLCGLLAELRAELSQVRGDSELYLHIGTNGSETIVRAGDQLRLASSPEALGRVQQHPLIAEVWSE